MRYEEAAETGPETGVAEGAVPTPMMAQYMEIKAQNPGILLFYRMGDFFEMFFEDAEIASRALNIALTKRGKHQGADIAMCGVPVARAEDYLQRLIAQGFRVAICEQLEDPAEAKKRGYKSVVKRGIVRLVTPGTITEESLLPARANNFLTAIHAEPGGAYTLASLDISTGEFFIGTVPATGLAGELMRIGPSEILTSDREPPLALPMLQCASTPVPAAYYNVLAGEAALKEALGVAHLDAFGEFGRADFAAAGALLKYAGVTQVGKMPAIRPPKRVLASGVMAIDAATRVNLELVRGSGGGKGLLGAIDRTVTAAGARELAQRLGSPLTDADAIAARHDAVAFFLGRAALRDDIIACLKAAPDMPRALSRLKLGRGSPRDLGLFRQGLNAAAEVAALLQPVREDLPAEVAAIIDGVAGVPGNLREALTVALNEDLPILVRDGGMVREGFRADLDEARMLGRDGRGLLAGLQTKYVAETGIRVLKVKHNNVLGYFIEVPATHAKVLSAHPEFSHRQTVSNAMRFVTPELTDIEGRVLASSERALAIEEEVFNALSRDIVAAEGALAQLTARLAELDCLTALAVLAEEQNYARPTVDNSLAFEIEGGRHPVVEQALRKSNAAAFIGNDCRLGGGGRVWILTGPNMAGKSTFLRQNAVIAILAQMGAFVPAASAHIGVVDKLFSRVGASDDLASGRSTFMVEMVETASILNQATERSFVILDEIGRGTATFDGLSIAWACLEYLHDVNRCRALFATHYHELTALPERLEAAANATMAVKEWKDEIVFLHQVRRGTADRSYGIQVAKLAGLPGAVVERARSVLALLEKGRKKGGKQPDLFDDLPLFAASRPEPPRPPEPSEVEKAVATLNPDEMTPREALEAIYRLRGLCKNV